MNATLEEAVSHHKEPVACIIAQKFKDFAYGGQFDPHDDAIDDSDGDDDDDNDDDDDDDDEERGLGLGAKSAQKRRAKSQQTGESL